MLRYREHMLIADQCWWPDLPPEWAVQAAADGAGGGLWCPLLRPGLRTGDTEADASDTTL
jgi:hypothetical protein